MKVAAIESFVASVPYRHREMSSVEAWGGAVDVLIWGVPERAGLHKAAKGGPPMICAIYARESTELTNMRGPHDRPR